MIKGDKVIQPNISSNVMVINGISIAMDVAAWITDDCTMLPFSWVAQAPGARLNWDEAAQAVTMEL
ncbi:MAG: copper amine oxidase N-terminal domain-containing protein [Bacillota bacterium]